MFAELYFTKIVIFILAFVWQASQYLFDKLLGSKAGPSGKQFVENIYLSRRLDSLWKKMPVYILQAIVEW